MKAKIFTLLFLFLLLGLVSAQNERVKEKSKLATQFVEATSEYTEKAKAGIFTDTDLAKLNKLFKESDSVQRSYITGEENVFIFNKQNRMRCYTAYLNILLRIKHYDEVAEIANQQFNLPDDALIVDNATAKSAHNYDTGNRVNDQYDRLVTGGFIMQRENYLKTAGTFYSGLMIAARVKKDYQLLSKLFEKGLKYGYFENLSPVIENNMGVSILTMYKTPADYTSAIMQAAIMIKETQDEITDKQKQTDDLTIKNNQKINEIFAIALKQDVSKAENIKSFGESLKYQLKDKTINDNDKAQLIKNNIDQWILQADYANRQWLVDESIYTAVGYFITQELFNPQDKVFCDKFCAFIDSHGSTVIDANPRLMYDCYLYYKKSEQKKLAKAFYKKYLKEKYSEQYPN